MARRILCVVLAGLFGACGSDDDLCTTDADCPSDRVCRQGLCALDPNAIPNGGPDVLLDVTLACPNALTGDLVLNEILADPAGLDADGNGTYDASLDEFIEIVNVGNQSLGTLGVSLQIGDKVIPLEPRCLESNEAMVVWGSYAKLSLTNSGATVSLLVGGAIAQSHSFGSEGGKGESLTLAVQLDPTSGWVGHGDLAETPFSPGSCANGAAFPNCTPDEPGPDSTTGDGSSTLCPGAGPEDLVLTEILADPGGKDANGDGHYDSADDEFVEIVNISSTSVGLTGVGIRVGDKVVDLGSACLEPGAAWVHFGADAKLSLTNSGATVELTIDEVAVQTVTYGSEGDKDQSLTLADQTDPDSPWVLHTDISAESCSPGTCPDGEPFPGCQGATPLPWMCQSSPGSGDLIINEIMGDPGDVRDANQDCVGSPVDDEYVEIVNIAGEGLDLSGVVLRDAEGETLYTFPPGACLVASQAAVVFPGLPAGVLNPDLGGAQLHYASGPLGLANAAGTLTLVTADGLEIDSVSYEKTDAYKQSVTRVRDLDMGVGMLPHRDAPRASGSPMSPGACQNGMPFPGCGAVANPCGGRADLADLLINEVLAAPPSGADINEDGNPSTTQDEFMELVNSGKRALDISGVTVSVGGKVKHTFPDASCLGYDEAIVLFAGGDAELMAFFAPGATVVVSDASLSLTNSGKDVSVETARGCTADFYVYEGLTGVSWTRSPDGQGPFIEHDEAPGSGGAAYSPGRCVDAAPIGSCLSDIAD